MESAGQSPRFHSFRIFLVLSFILLLFDTILVSYNYHESIHHLDEHLHSECNKLQTFLKISLSQTEHNMLQIANYLAHDPRVQELFHKGVLALEKDHGDFDGPHTTQARNALHDYVVTPWKELQDWSDYRQLHFHLPPGSISFLRVHKPEKYGDNMDSVRHTIVAANQTHKPTKGFETGRVISGIRGVVPVSISDPRSGQPLHLGVLEAGTSFDVVLRTVHQHFKANIVVVLKNEHLRRTLWPQFYQKFTKQNPLSTSDYILEASTPGANLGLLTPELLSQFGKKAGWRKIQYQNQWYSINAIPLYDFLHQLQPERPPIGLIVCFKDITPEVHEANTSSLNLLFIALFGYILAEITLYYGIQFTVRTLEQHITTATSEIQQQNEQLRSLNEEKNTFLSIASHDLKNPIANIISCADLIRDTSSGLPEKTTRLAKVIHLSARQMLDLVTNLLDFHRIETQPGLPSLETFDLSCTLQRVIENQRSQASAKDQTLHAIGFEEPLLISSVEQYWKQITENLVSNAIKFTPAGGTISVTLHKTSGHTTLTVKDSGPGLTQQDHHHLFKKFAKLSARPTAGENSSGLGLAIVKLLCKILGASIHCESQPGQGASFIVTHPGDTPIAQG